MPRSDAVQLQRSSCIHSPGSLRRRCSRLIKKIHRGWGIGGLARCPALPLAAVLASSTGRARGPAARMLARAASAPLTSLNPLKSLRMAPPESPVRPRVLPRPWLPGGVLLLDPAARHPAPPPPGHKPAQHGRASAEFRAPGTYRSVRCLRPSCGRRQRCRRPPAEARHAPGGAVSSGGSEVRESV